MVNRVYSHDEFMKMFQLFFMSLKPSMFPPQLTKLGLNAEHYWHGRFVEALQGDKPTLSNESYTQLAIVWLHAYQEQQKEINYLNLQLKKLRKNMI